MYEASTRKFGKNEENIGKSDWVVHGKWCIGYELLR